MKESRMTSNRKKLISFVIPCFNEEENVPQVYLELKKVITKIKNYAYEFVFIDNGSSDDTRREIRSLAKKDKNVVGIFLSRNFGPEASTHAGLDKASGDAVIIYEADLQDPSDLIPEFIGRWENGVDIVVGIRTKIEDSLIMTFFRRAFYKIFRAISDIYIPVNSGSYGLLDRKVLKAIQSLPEKFRMFRGLRAWVGFKTDYVEYKRQKRKRGKSSYNFFGYIKHAERSFFGFSYLPLDLMVYFGFALVLLSFIFIIVYLLIFLLFGNPIKAAVTIVVGIVFFGGIQLLAISIIGKYIQVIVEETKARPVYIIDEILNEKKKSDRRELTR